MQRLILKHQLIDVGKCASAEKRDKKSHYLTAINLLNIKKEGFIPLSLDRLSITVYFSFLASYKKSIVFSQNKRMRLQGYF
ncbi:hypothetical protein OA098_01935 [Prochlorococcus sp. AH-736-B04]|nr:hypothetical protein [Prochlorococcus sp. AH-736-B04]